MINPFSDYDLDIDLTKYKKELGLVTLPSSNKKSIKIRGKWFIILGYWQGRVYLKNKI